MRTIAIDIFVPNVPKSIIILSLVLMAFPLDSDSASIKSVMGVTL